MANHLHCRSHPSFERYISTVHPISVDSNRMEKKTHRLIIACVCIDAFCLSASLLPFNTRTTSPANLSSTVRPPRDSLAFKIHFTAHRTCCFSLRATGICIFFVDFRCCVIRTMGIVRSIAERRRGSGDARVRVCRKRRTRDARFSAVCRLPSCWRSDAR